MGSNVGMMHYQALLLDQLHICFFFSFLMACTITSRLPNTFFCKTSAINPVSLLAGSIAAEPLLNCLQVTAVQLRRPDLTDASAQPHLSVCSPQRLLYAFPGPIFPDLCMRLDPNLLLYSMNVPGTCHHSEQCPVS